MATATTTVDWMNVGTTSTVDALVLRFAAVLNGLDREVGSADTTWFLVNADGQLVDCGAADAVPLLGSPVTRLLGGLVDRELEAAWHQVLLGRAQTVWPWRGGRARATMRSIELHPLRDLMGDPPSVIGALVVIVDVDARREPLAA